MGNQKGDLQTKRTPKRIGGNPISKGKKTGKKTKFKKTPLGKEV